jgi:hypothetical protein
MIKRQLKQKNFINIDILPRQLKNIDAKKKWDEEQFGKKVRVARFPIDFNKGISELSNILKEQKTENTNDIKKIISLLGTLLDNKSIETLSDEKLQILENAIRHSTFPSNREEFGLNRYISKNEINRRRSTINGLILRNWSSKNNLQKTTGARQLEKPLWKYKKTDNNPLIDYEFIPVGLIELTRMKTDWDLDLDYLAMLPDKFGIDEEDGMIFEDEGEEEVPIKEEGEEEEEEEEGEDELPELL